MNTQLTHTLVRSLGLTALLATTAAQVQAQTAYGVDSTGALFSFSLSSPGTTNSIGSLGFTPEAIDFRPEAATFLGAARLYAIDVNSITGAAQLYTVNTSTGTASAVGAGFTSTKLVGATSVGFDFNPTTLQVDGSIRIRLIANNQANLRLNSDTGNLAATDTDLTAAGIVGGAYINTTFGVLPANGTTTLFDINATSNFLVSQVPPNNGVLNDIGAGLGFNVGSDVGFDIYTAGLVNTGYLVDTTGINAAMLYSVNLTTGAATSVGSVSRDFTGGFAVQQIPEPSSFAALAGVVGLGMAAARRRRTA